MRLHMKVTLATTALMLAFSGAAVAAPKYAPDYQPDPAPAPPPHAKAHGFHCKGFSKKHVKGEKGTPFSQCVKRVVRMRKEQRKLATVAAAAIA